MEEQKKMSLMQRWKNLLRRCGGERVFVALFLVLAMAAGFLGTILLPKEEFSENENRMLETLDTRDSCAKVRQCVEHCLNEREAKVISLRYGLDGEGPRTQREIATACGISRSYVSRLEKKALAKLREEMEKKP